MIVRQAPPEDFGWLIHRVGCAPTTDFRAIEAVHEDGRIAGMIAFDTWWGNAAQMHFAIDEPLCFRKLAPEAFRYVFSMAKRDVVVGWVPESRADLHSLALRLGFTELCRVKDGWGRGVDVIMVELRRENCRWLKERN